MDVLDGENFPEVEDNKGLTIGQLILPDMVAVAPEGVGFLREIGHRSNLRVFEAKGRIGLGGVGSRRSRSDALIEGAENEQEWIVFGVEQFGEPSEEKTLYENGRPIIR